MSDPVQSSEPQKSGLIPPILIYLAAIAALVTGIGVMTAKILLSTGVPVPGVAPAATPAASREVPTAAAIPAERILVGNLAVEASQQKLRVSSRGSTIVEFSAPARTSLQWIAAIRDPYAALEIGDGSPFLADAKADIPIGDSIGGLTLANGTFKALSEKDFPRFPFFSAAPTTIGFVFGSARSGDAQRGVTLYFIDTATDAVATIPIPVFMFPEWQRDRGFPPPFIIRREIVLGSGALTVPEIVTISVQGFAAGRYSDDQANRGLIAAAEFKRAFLTKDELAGLKNTDFSSAADESSALRPALQKIVRLLWYGKMLGRGDSLNALVDQLHPTTAQTIRSNSSLSPK